MTTHPITETTSTTTAAAAAAAATATATGGLQNPAAHPYAEQMRQLEETLLHHPAHRPSIRPPEPPPPPRFEMLPPSYFADFELPKDAVLVGDCHITRGDMMLLAGVAGSGKSRLLASLAIAGKQGRGSTWMGLPVHASFKTAILQAENGPVRLKAELGDIMDQGHDLDGHLFISPPPPRGITFLDAAFCAEVRAWLEQEKPGVFALDPWNRAVTDDKGKDFREILDAIESCLPAHPHRPAVVIVTHLRKQQSGEGRKTGRDLLPEVSGSHVLTSACRCAFIIEPASPDPDDNRIILTCAKNNNGAMPPSTAWHRRNGLFEACPDFDWKEWRAGSAGGGSKKRHAVELEDLAEIFEDGEKVLSKNDAVKALTRLEGIGRSAAYAAIKPDGRFGDHLSECGGFITFRA